MNTDSDFVRDAWRALIDVFGPQWTDTYGAVPSAAWREAMHALGPAAVGRGVRYFAVVHTAERAYPPNLPEFRHRCLGGVSASDADAQVERCLAAVRDDNRGALSPADVALLATVPYWDQRELRTSELRLRLRNAARTELEYAPEPIALPAPKAASELAALLGAAQ